MPLELSVVVCTHNPRTHFLARTLEALRTQTLPQVDWELLLVDNASSEQLAHSVDLTWHSAGRHIREEALGLTPARLRGIAEANAELIVFVDDDNVLNPDYLEQALALGREYPFLGAWGGQVLPEFEAPPPEWTRPFWPYLACREVQADLWSNLPWTSPTTPWGAGLCVRRSVARRYAEHCSADETRRAFDRKGAQQLTSCGDVDLALTACEEGLGNGVFRRLELTHLIPPERLDEGYLLRLAESSNYSSALLLALRGVQTPTAPPPRWRRMGRHLLDLVSLSQRDRRFKRAIERGCERAAREARCSR